MKSRPARRLAQNYRLEVTNPGGHSSRPVKDNAIYHLAAALTRSRPTSSRRSSPTATAPTSPAWRRSRRPRARARRGGGHERAGARIPNDAKAIALVSAKDPSWNATLRTTCVATMLDAGHATNALPQRARANINCRIFPGVSQETVRAQARGAGRRPGGQGHDARRPAARARPPPPLTPQILGPVEKLAAEFWPGVPVLPILQPGATDGEFLNAAGIPTYGIEPLFAGPDLGHIHGLNEYVSVKSLMDGRDFLYRLIKIYADQK